ncbi:MAG TPA: alpha/beta hydrolase, partial [Polyangia bacterium]|nr:alpha/beta hydrolase [Polyangia bacterium]
MPVVSEVRAFVVDDDGLTLSADVGGDASAPPVILMHGGGQTRHSWAGAMRELVAAGYYVVNLDARGHGDSDWSARGDYRTAVQAEDLRAVIRQLPRRPAVVGASMGGMTALYAVGTAPTPIADALVLVDIVPRVELVGADRIGHFMRAHPAGFATIDEAVDAVAAYNPHRPRPRDPSGLMRNLRRRDDGRLHWHWDPKFVAQTFESAEPPLLVGPLHEAADRVRIPTLLVRGLRSDLVSDRGIAELRTHLPQLEVLDISGAGHMVAGDKNDAFNDGVIAFL